MSSDKFFAGDRVALRSPQEIISTLDCNGTLDGLPFMPEMLKWCGKSFVVQRRVEKTCVAVDPPIDSNRHFSKGDVVILEDLRCDGSQHDGCKHGCRIYWKEAWLRSANREDRVEAADEDALPVLRARLKVKSDEQHYFCQSTELLRATEAVPGRMKPWLFRIAFRQIRQRDLSAAHVLKLFMRWLGMKIRRARGADNRLRGGNASGTPVQVLDLKPGELVRVKDLNQIVATLDRKRRNRGMGICQEMAGCCGMVAKVRYRVDRLIDEKSGKMRELSHTVTLEDPQDRPSQLDECLCYQELGDCPRGELMFWREIWLERLNGHGGTGPGSDEGA